MDNQNPAPQPAAPASAPVTPSGTAYTPPPSQIPPSPPPSPLSPTPAPSSHKRLFLIACTLFVILLAGGGYVFMNMQQPKPAMKPTPSPIPSPSAIPTPTVMASPSAMASDSANWKTYTSPDKTYTIQYPLDTFIQYLCQGEELRLVPRGDAKEESVAMDTCARDSRFTIETVTYSQLPTPWKSDEYYQVIKKDITVAGIPAQQYTVTQIKQPEGPGIEFSKYVYVPYKGKYYEFYLGEKNLVDTFDTMLSTVTFLK